jgi:tRNA G18 (ribose-2'-O)-methylase SpoU
MEETVNRVSAININDPRLDLYRDLKRSNKNRLTNTFIAEGGKLLDRLIDVGWPLVSVVLTPAACEIYERRLPPDVPVYLLDKEPIEELIGFNFHRGVLACGRRPDFPDWRRLVPPPHGEGTLLILVDIHDPENVGNIIRSAAALGVSAIGMTPLCADPFSRRVLRTSMGGVLLTPITIIDSPGEVLEELSTKHGIDIWATVLDPSASPLKDAKPTGRQVIVVGNEGDGLPADCVARCTQKVTIPMAAGADSLNVAVATGIVLYQFLRSR